MWIEIYNLQGIRSTILSLPTRECGLKYSITTFSVSGQPSLPTRECGLKCTLSTKDVLKFGHSLRGSVDWNTCLPSGRHWKHVTPYAGVWIEILIHLIHSDTRRVTPYAGVWIEIADEHTPVLPKTYVTPYAGVWIEIFDKWAYTQILSGHSLRGSVDWNFIAFIVTEKADASLPTRECGLKLKFWIRISHKNFVTPYAGVWIEIESTWQNQTGGKSLPTRECGLKLSFS